MGRGKPLRVGVRCKGAIPESPQKQVMYERGQGPRPASTAVKEQQLAVPECLLRAMPH